MKKLLLITPVVALLAGCSLQQNAPINQEPLAQTGTEISTGTSIQKPTNNITTIETKEIETWKDMNKRESFDYSNFGIRFSLQKWYKAIDGYFEIINKIEVKWNLIQILSKDTRNKEGWFYKGPTITLISLKDWQTPEAYVSSRIKKEFTGLCSVHAYSDTLTRLNFASTKKAIEKYPDVLVVDTMTACKLDEDERYVYNPNFPKKLFKVTWLGTQADDAPWLRDSIEIYK